MHDKYHLLTYEGVLNPSMHGETDNRHTKSTSSMVMKRTTYGRRKIGLIRKQGIGGDKIGLIEIH